jgi:Tfp pilus assembly protein PilF
LETKLIAQNVQEKASPSAWKWAPMLAGAVIVLAAVGAYHNSFRAPFIFDDAFSILQNPTIRQLWPIGHALSPPPESVVGGRPVLNLSFAVNHALGGTAVRGYHALNLIIHILAGLTLLGIVRRTLLQPALRGRFGDAAPPLALAVAVIWTVHPVQTESVTYLSQRAESLMGLFYLVTLYCFIRGAGSSAPGVWYTLSVAACLLGMASKEVMASAPLVVLFYDRTFVGGTFRSALRQRWRLYLGLAGTWLVLGFLMVGLANRKAGFHVGVSWWIYALTECRAIVHYLQLAVWPHPLVFDYGLDLVKRAVDVAPYALILVLLVAGTGIALRFWPALGFVGVWFLAILAPDSSVVPVAGSPMAEHRLYLPLAAVVTLEVIGIHALLGCRSVPVIGALAIGLGFLTVRRNEDYRSPVALWQDTVNKCPENPRAQYNLGVALDEAGRAADAIKHYEETLRMKPDSAETHNNLGAALLEVGRIEEAINHYEQAVRIKPDHVGAHSNLAWILATDDNERLRDPARAVQLAERACQLTERRDAGVLDTLAAAYAAAGRFGEAVLTAQQAVGLAVAAGQKELAKDIQGRLKLYEAGQPFRRKPAATPDT